MFLIVLLLIILIGLLSYYIIFSRIKISSFHLENSSFNEAVSIIICAKNELENIKNFFPFWINQEYQNFELIIVNDQSTDETLQYLNSLKAIHSNLKIVNIDVSEKKILKGKRHALNAGISASISDYILLTDADCKPLSKLWLKEMTQAFNNPKTEIVLGASPYRKESGFLNKLIQFETLLTALQYLGFAQLSLPYMGLGRNIAYKKSVLSKKIFDSSNLSISGDDDLIAQQIMTSGNTEYIVSKNTVVESLAAKSFKEWYLQKRRHLSAGVYYQLKFKIILGLFVLLNVLFLIVSCFSFYHFPIYTLLLVLFRSILFYFSMIKLSKKIDNKPFSFMDFIITDIIYWLFYTIFALSVL